MLRTIYILAACLLLTISQLSGQQKIGDNPLVLDPASLLELESTSQGFLPSRLTTAQRDAQTSWNEGHIIYNTTESCLQVYNGSSWDCFVQGSVIDSTIYNYNGALLSDRVVTMNSFQLTFDGSGSGDVVITESGFVGIGDPTPEAKLDVEGGTVRLSDYGSGTNNGSESYLLGVDSDGDVIEISPAIDTFSLIGDELRISLRGDRQAYDSISLSKYLDDVNIYEDEGTITANRTMSLNGNWFRTLGNDNGSNIQLQNDGDLRQYGPGVLHQLVDTSGAELRSFSGPTSSYISSLEDVPFYLRQDGNNTIGLLSNDYIRLYNYGAGSRTGAPAFLLGVQADGDLVDVDISSIGSDDQILDSLGLTGTTLEVGIEGDANGLQTLDLSSLQDGTGTDDQNITGSGLSGTTLTIGIEGGSSQDVNLSALQDGTGTDDQILDSLGLTGTTLEVGIEGDANGLQTLDLSSLQDGTGTDDQNITGSGLSGTTLTIGIEGGSSQDVNLSALQDGTGTDDQILDSLGLTGTTLEVGIEGDVNGLQTLDLSSLQDGTGTDDQNITGSGLSGTTLTIGIEGGSSQDVNLSALQDGTGTDDQILDSLGLTGTTLEIGIEGDVNGLQTVDLSSLTDINIYEDNGTLTANRTVGLSTFDLIFDGTNDVIIQDDGNVGIGIAAPERPLHVEGALRLSRSGNTTSFIFDRYNSTLSTIWKSYIMGVNASSAGNGEFFIGDYNEAVSGGGYSRMLTLNDATEPIRFDQYTGANFISGAETHLLGVEADGDIVRVTTSSIGSDDQILDSLGLTGTTLEIGIEGDVNGLQSLDLSSLQDGTGTDDQNITGSGLSGTTLTIGIEGGSSQDVNLAGLQDGTGTDDQIIDSIGLDGNTLNIELEGDVNGLQSVDLTPILGSSENIYNTSDALENDREVTLDGNDLSFIGSVDTMIIHSDGDISIGTSIANGDFNVESSESQDAFHFTQVGVTSGENDVFTIEDQDVGGGGQDSSSVLKVLKSGSISTGDNGFSLVELAYTGSTDPGANKYWISGRRNDEVEPLWGVDVTDNDFWSEGGIVLGVTGATNGTYSGGNFIVEPDGDVGIGTTSPGARLEVSGGSVIFDQYGGSTHKDSLADNIIAVDASGNIVELNTLQNTRWFYAPAVTIDASSEVDNATIDLHQEYVDQFSSIPAAQRSSGAPASLPTYAEDELHYYVTFFDNAVIDDISISEEGVLQYDIISVPFDNYTIVNVIFMVK